ncbi:MAG: aldose 1-epimerase family protein [Sphingobacteriaceae bacterium]|nr:aldose 1-epimerase family protein [Sphingobacteriaceae bacterium]
MFVDLHSEYLTVKLNHQGAEIVSIKNTQQHEYIWQANPEIWGRHAPVLFPIVGKLFNNHYSVNNCNYTLPQHGFARDSTFVLIHSNNEECLFQLNHSDKSLQSFPFFFELNINYKLNKNKLQITYTVVNKDTQTIYFSIGAHPGFNILDKNAKNLQNHYLEFEKNELELSELKDGLLANNKRILQLDNHKLWLNTNLFDNDALVLENNQINKISFGSTESDRKIIIECERWPYFGIWSKKNNDQFICLEPWYGITSSVNRDSDFTNKKGIIKLEINSFFECVHSISIL